MPLAINLICIATGGALGACTRYLIAIGSEKLVPVAFPIGTLIVNCLGCMAMGFLIGFGISHQQNRFYLTFAVGFLGSLTTFSAFGGETFRHVMDEQHATAGLNVAANVLFSLVAVFIGFWLGKSSATT